MQRVAIPLRAEKANWRVEFWDFRDHHDYVGRRLLDHRARRRPPPRKQVRDFVTREAATKFIATLQDEYGADEIAATIIDLTKRTAPSPRPQNQLLPGDWPLECRRTEDE
jgi:hypothetical protein